jgi:hypothetical protein
LGAGKVSMSDLSVTSNEARVVSPRDSASGLPTGKRMHKPVTSSPVVGGDASASNSADLQTVSVVLPAAESGTSRALDRACASGTHIKNAELSNSAQRYAMTDVVVSSCSASSSERRYEFRGHVTLLRRGLARGAALLKSVARHRDRREDS